MRDHEKGHPPDAPATPANQERLLKFGWHGLFPTGTSEDAPASALSGHYPLAEESRKAVPGLSRWGVSLLAFLRRVADGVGVGLGVVLAFLRWRRGFRQDDSGFGAGHDVVGLFGG